MQTVAEVHAESGERAFAKETHRRLDFLGILVSGACAIHCLLLPLLVGILPLVGLAFIADDTFERYVLLTSVILGAISLGWGTWKHRDIRVPVMAIAGLLLFGMALQHHEQVFHGLLMGTGGLFLAFGHFLNQQLCATCKHCHHHE